MASDFTIEKKERNERKEKEKKEMQSNGSYAVLLCFTMCCTAINYTQKL